MNCLSVCPSPIGARGFLETVYGLPIRLAVVYAHHAALAGTDLGNVQFAPSIERQADVENPPS